MTPSNNVVLIGANGTKKGLATINPLTNPRQVCYINNMAYMVDRLRQEVRASGLSMKMLSRKSGVNRISLMRFMRGETALNMVAASRLAEFLDLELQPKRNCKGDE